MNKHLLNALIIEDHPLIINAYENALKQVSDNNKNLELSIAVASDCDVALAKIEHALNGKKINLIFLDIKLPASKDGNIISGEDLGIKIRDALPNTKIIISTTYNDNYRVNTIFKSVNPDGFLIKNDLNPKELVLAIEQIIDDMPYYSKSVIQLMRKQTSNDIFLDSLDRKLLYELSQGAKMSELPDKLALSIAALERRKRALKDIFNVKTDRELFRIAEEKGFI